MKTQSKQIVLFTDFGSTGPYVGQVKSVLYTHAPEAKVIDLLNDLPAFSAVRAGYLLASYCLSFPVGTVFLSVVDPGVGTDSRTPVVVWANGQVFVGPDNGLFNALENQQQDVVKREIRWLPDKISNSFHGRDLFAPVAARIVNIDLPEDWLGGPQVCGAEPSKADINEIVYIDPFGNLVSGQRVAKIDKGATLLIGSSEIGFAPTFGAVKPGIPFWYENSNGLLEIAVNQGSAASVLGVGIGERFVIQSA